MLFLMFCQKNPRIVAHKAVGKLFFIYKKHHKSKDYRVLESAWLSPLFWKELDKEILFFYALCVVP